MIVVLFWLISVVCNIIDITTYSLAYFTPGNANIDTIIQVDSVIISIPNVLIGKYYNFEYSIGQSLEVRTIFDGPKKGYFLVKNGGEGTGKTIYDSRTTTFYVINKCPEDQLECKFSLNGYNEIDPLTLDVYVNNVLILEDFNFGIGMILISYGDVIEVIVSGTTTNESAVVTFVTLSMDEVYTYGQYDWYYNNLVTAAVIETVGFVMPVDGTYVNSGNRVTVQLLSTPQAESYNIQLTCGQLPPVTQSIISNSLTTQQFYIPTGYYGPPCLLSVIDTPSGINTSAVIIVLSNQEIVQCAKIFASGNYYSIEP